MFWRFGTRNIKGDNSRNKQAIGHSAEQTALAFLKEKGLVLLEQNFRSKRGEIDLIMRDTDSIAFIEVRYRRRKDFGSALESVDIRKQAKLANCAAYYLLQNPKLAKHSCRFDVISISPAGYGETQPVINWIKDAFYPPGS
jgi:putative endonuclease